MFIQERTKINKQEELSLSRIAIYDNYISIRETVEKIKLNEFREGSSFWEYEIPDKRFGTNELRLFPVKVGKKTIRTGSKRQKIKKVIYTLTQPSVKYSIHSLNQYNTRNFGKEISFNEFFSIPLKYNDWISRLPELNEEVGDSNYENYQVRKDYLLPFGDGAFLGCAVIGTGFGSNKDQYINDYTNGYREFHYKTFDLDGNPVPLNNPCFSASTYIRKEQFNKFQQRVFEEVNDGDLDAGIETLRNNHLHTKTRQIPININPLKLVC
jgi:hypothetical protein